MDLLPEELLADILGRLPPRPTAVCRSVSKGLRAVIDGQGLLLALEHRIPRSMRGIFVNYVGQSAPYFFSRPERASPRIDPDLSFLPVDRVPWKEVVHSCNGLLLFQDWSTLYVCNPATRRWAELPPRPAGFAGGGSVHLVFDPTVSLHYDVISFSEVPRRPKIHIQPDIKRSDFYNGSSEYYTDEIENLPSSLRAEYDREGSAEWPPSSYVAQVLSSRRGQWEERVYVREDDVAVTLSDVWSDPWGPYGGALTYNVPRRNAVCWKGAFYIHCLGSFIIRLSLLEKKYRVIKTPKLENVFTQPTLDINDFLSQEGPDIDDFSILHGLYKTKEDCLREFQMEQEFLDRQKPSMHLGKSEHGIYYAAVFWHQLRVWVLHEASESRPYPEWELKHKADIKPSFVRHFTWEDIEEIEASWSLDRGGSDDEEEDCGWNSSDDSVISVEGEEDIVYNDDDCLNMNSRMNFLGYHPSKEIAFLGNRFQGFAYYLGSSKLQYLGTFYPKGCDHPQVAATHEAFIYTPCVDDLLPNEVEDLEEELVDTDEDEDLEDEVVDTDEDKYLEEEELGIDEDEDLEEYEDLKGLEDSDV